MLPTPIILPLKTHHHFTGGWFLLGLLMVAGAFAYLERTQPFYFTQDDALVAELPGTIAGCRSVWNGIWPEYDPCRLAGGPLAGEGLSSLTYPPMYLCYAIARHTLHNEYTTFEVFAILHLLAGYCLTYRLFRRRCIRPMIACCASLSFVLSGSILIMGRSWHTHLAIVTWMPLLVIAIDRLREGGKVGVGWAVRTGLVAGTIYHVGFPQLWVYAMLFLGFATVWLFMMKQIDWRRLLTAIAAGLIALGVSAPLIVPQLLLARFADRPQTYGSGLHLQWIAALLPYPLIQVDHPMFWGSTDTQYMGHFIYFGTTFFILFLMSAVAMCTTGPQRASLGDHVWTVCAVVAAVLSVGRFGGIFYLLSQLPLIGTVNNDPFRGLPFFVLFAVVSGATFADRSICKNERLRRVAPIIASITIALLSYHVFMARPSFYSFGFRPYPPLDPAVAEHLKDPSSGRMLSWSPIRSISKKFTAAIPDDLPLVYGIAAFGGYDPLLEYTRSYSEMRKNLFETPVQAARAYGVRWHLISDLMFDPVLSPNVRQNGMERSTQYREIFDAIYGNLKYIAQIDGAYLTELRDVSPMAFPTAKPDFSLPLAADGHGITVQLSSWKEGGDIVVNFAWYPQLQAVVDGKGAPIAHDDWQRIVVAVPAGAKMMEISYAAGWNKGIVLGVGLLLVGILAASAINRG